MASDILPSVGIFSALGESSRRTLTASGRVDRLNAGDVLILEGHPQACLYSVLEGELAASFLLKGKTVELGRLHFGDCFGEMGMLEKQPASASVVAVVSSVVWSVAEPQFEQFLLQNHLAGAQVLLAIGRVLSRRLRYANNLIRRNNVIPLSLSFRGPGEPVTFETSRDGLVQRFRDRT